MASTTDSISLEVETDEDLLMGNREGLPFAISLLLDATEKEQKNLNVVEDCMRDLEFALKERRRSIKEQRTMLKDLAEALTTTSKGN